MADLLLGGTVAPQNTTYPIARASQLLAGLHAAADFAGLSSIPVAFLTAGETLAITKDDGSVYRLEMDGTTWTLLIRGTLEDDLAAVEARAEEAFDLAYNAYYLANQAALFPPKNSWKKAVRIVTTTNITLSGEQTIQGVSLVAVGSEVGGDRVLVAGQTIATQNGPYHVQTGAWIRTEDGDSGTGPGLNGVDTYDQFPVQEGTYAGQVWQLMTPRPINVNITNLTYAESERTPTEAGWRAKAAVLTANPAFNSRKLTLVADPTSAQDAATKAYVDASPPINSVNSQTASFTVSAAMNKVLQDCSHASNEIVATIPTNATTAMPVGTLIPLGRSGAGRVCFMPATGVTFVGSGTWYSKRGGMIYAHKTATDTWRIFGPDLLVMNGRTSPYSGSNQQITANPGGGVGVSTGFGISFIGIQLKSGNSNFVLASRGNATSTGWLVQNIGSGYQGRFANGGGTVINSPAKSMAAADVGKIHSLHFIFDNAASLVRTVANGAQVGSGTACSGYTSQTSAMTVGQGNTLSDLGLISMVYWEGAYNLTNLQAWDADCKAFRKAGAMNGATLSKVWNFHLTDMWPVINEELAGAAADQIQNSVAASIPLAEEIRQVQYAY